MSDPEGEREVVQVPTARDPLTGRLILWIDVDPEAAIDWDERVWRANP